MEKPPFKYGQKVICKDLTLIANPALKIGACYTILNCWKEDSWLVHLVESGPKQAFKACRFERTEAAMEAVIAQHRENDARDVDGKPLEVGREYFALGSTGTFKLRAVEFVDGFIRVRMNDGYTFAPNELKRAWPQPRNRSCPGCQGLQLKEGEGCPDCIQKAHKAAKGPPWDDSFLEKEECAALCPKCGAKESEQHHEFCATRYVPIEEREKKFWDDHRAKLKELNCPPLDSKGNPLFKPRNVTTLENIAKANVLASVENAIAANPLQPEERRAYITLTGSKSPERPVRKHTCLDCKKSHGCTDCVHAFEPYENECLHCGKKKIAGLA